MSKMHAPSADRLDRLELVMLAPQILDMHNNDA